MEGWPGQQGTTPDVPAAFKALPTEVEASHMLLSPPPGVGLFDHAQGIALHRRLEADIPRLRMFATYSGTKGVGGRLGPGRIIMDDPSAGRPHVTKMQRLNHPGGIGVAGPYLVVPCEHGRERARLEYYLATDPNGPRRVSHYGLLQPRFDPGDPDREVLGNRHKASAAAAAFRRDVLWTAVISDNRFIRLVRASENEAPRQVAVIDGFRVEKWPRGVKIEGIGLIAGDNDELWLFLLASKTTGGEENPARRFLRWLPRFLGRGRDSIGLYELTIPCQIEGDRWPGEADDLDTAAFLRHVCSRPIRLRGGGWLFRPSLRWGSSLFSVEDKRLCLLVSNRSGNDKLEIAHSKGAGWPRTPDQ